MRAGGGSNSNVGIQREAPPACACVGRGIVTLSGQRYERRDTSERWRFAERAQGELHSRRAAVRSAAPRPGARACQQIAETAADSSAQPADSNACSASMRRRGQHPAGEAMTGQHATAARARPHSRRRSCCSAATLQWRPRGLRSAGATNGAELNSGLALASAALSEPVPGPRKAKAKS